MNKIIFLFFGLIVIQNSYSQCGFDNVLVGVPISLACPTSSQVTLTSGEYAEVDVIAGVTYTFTTCGLTGCDTQITLYDAAGTTVLGYNDDACGLQTIVTWVATYTGTANLLLDQFFCANGCTSAIDISCSAPPGPPPPPPCGTPVVFNFNGGVQNYVVPPGVTSITLVVEGAQGGDAFDTFGNPVAGGAGASITVTIPVVPGDIIGMTVGGQGGIGTTTGFNGGGSGFFSNDGDINNASASGGGSTNVTINGSTFIIAAGGGGAGGGSWTFAAEDNFGGDGGCATGEAPAPGSPWIGVGGGGGSQVAPGVGGAPWAGVPPGGSPGVAGTGGIGGQWDTAPGGGGGGGYFGGGGGGNDGCCTGANGGAGGGGGSSLIPGGGGCIQGANLGDGVCTIYVPTPNTMTSTNVTTICSGGTVNIPLTSTVPGSTFEWIATDNVNVTGESLVLQTTATLNNTLTNLTTAVQTVTYTVTPSTVGCPGTPQTVTVTVNPFPQMTSTSAVSICSGTAVNLALTSNIAGTTFSWVAAANGNVSGESTLAQSSATITNVLTNTTAAVQTVTYTVTPTGPAPSFCLGPAQIVTVTVNPKPVITSTNIQTICSGGTVNIPLTATIVGTTFSWIATANANVIGESTTAQATSLINNTLTNTTAVVQTVTYTVTPTGPAPSFCVGLAQTVTITVNPTPTMTSPVAQTICSGTAVNIALTANVAGSTFSWIATANANVTGESTSTQTTALINNTLVNTTSVVQTVTYTVTPTGPGPSFCPGALQIVTVTVDPLATVNANIDQTICAGGTITLAGVIGGGATTSTWSAPTGAFSNVNSLSSTYTPSIASGTVTLTLTTNDPAGPCLAVTDQMIVTVNPVPVIAVAGVNPTTCGGNNGTITITGLAAATNYSVSYNNPGLVGPAVMLSNGVGAITITGLTAGTYSGFSVTLNGCTSTSATVIVLADPNPPTVNDPADQILCANIATAAVNYTGTAGATFNWTNNTVSIGLGASGVGNIPSFVATNITGAPVVATITVTPFLAGCTGTAQTFTITVNPPATTNANIDQTICAGGTITLAGAIGGGATTSTWSAPTGAFSNVNSLTSTYTPSIASGNVTLTLTTNDPAGPCLAVTDQMIVTVNPVPVIAVAGVNPTTCGGNNGTITITGLAAATNYSVSYNNPGLVGPAVMLSNGVGAITITGLTAGTYSGFSVTLNGCTSTSATVIVLADPNPPTVNDPADQILCANIATAAVNYTGTAGATFNWTNNTASIGLGASGVGNIPSFVATNITGAPVVATITVTPTLAGCTGTAQTFTITVNPIPTVTDPVDQSLCANSPTTAVNFTGSIVGTTFNWTNNNATIGLGAAGVGDIPSFTALNAVPGTTVVATITVTPTINGCPGTPQTFTISVVNTLPSLNCPGNLTAICSITEQPPYANFAAFTGAGGTANSVGGVIQPATFVLVSEVSNLGTCPEIFTRTYSIQDDCGSTATCTQTITVDDNINPTGTAPANFTVECITDVPLSNVALITDEADNCAPPAVTFIGDVSNLGTCPEIITRTYRITDACGNFIDVTQTITVDDTTNPTASNPANFNGSAVPAVDITVVIDEADNCSVPVVAFVSDVTDGLNCPETITRTYSVTDACGNTINVTQLIIIGDPFPPTASNPAPVAVQCIALVPAANSAVVIDEADNNGVPVVAFVSDVSNGLTCPEIITRTYSVTDACANVILVTQTITVDDNINPTGTAPANVAVQCIANVPVSNIALIVDEADNCAVPTVTFIGDVSNGLTCPEIITRTYRITDACGNFIDVTQTITVDDTTNPTASNPAGVTVQCIGDVPASNTADVIDEADNCSVPTVLFVGDVSDGNLCPETITRTYSVTDACGNTINVTQTIIVDDTTNPTASNPALIVVPGGPAPAPDPLVVIDEADNCSVPVVAFVSDVTDGNLCPETITRTYSVTDACGNQILVTQLIQITDPIMPTASNPAPVAVQCIALVPAANPAVVIDEADNNGVPVVAFVSDVSDGNTCPEIITRTYSVTDACANVILVTQTITVDDNINPTGTAPANVAVQCIANVPVSNIALIVDEADNCAVPTVTFIGDVSNGLTCPEIITRTYRITDACGNFIDVTQTITVDDTTNPTASNPAGVTVQCIGDVPASNTADVIDEADNCSVPTVLFVGDVSDGNLCPETITRTYSVTDACGNTINVTQTIIVDDTTNPTASNPALIVVPGGPAPAPNPLVVIDEADNCSVPVVAFVSDVTDGNPCPETITRTYSVTDACGNQILVTQLIQITDPIMPTASNPAAVNVECIGQVPAPDPLVVIDEADNNVTAPTVLFVSDVSDGNTCPETITRTYSVTDVCGNQILVTQIITVNDIINPTGTAPANVAVQCIANVPVSNIALIVDEADNCAVPTVTFIGDVSNGLTCPEIITRTYRITDACGNFIDVTQTIIVDDTTNPTASNPAGVTVQCIGDVPGSDPTVVIDEADNCTVNPTVAFVSDVSDFNTCPETITRTYSVTDACGNTINVTQTIIVDDTTNPTASNPAAINVTCASAVPAPDPSVVTTEVDNCTIIPLVAFVNDVSDGNVCNNETITRTYSVTDNCGNSINVTQQIIIGVTTPSVNAGIDQAVCEGVQVTLTANNPDAAVITWDNAVVNGAAFTSPLGTTTYTATATQCGGECFATDQVNVTVNPLPVVAFTADTLIGCYPLVVTFTNQTIPLGNNCQWTFGDGNSAIGCGDVINTYNTAGTFDVGLTVTTLDGCTSSTTYSNYITIADQPVAEFTYLPSVISIENTEVEFENASTNADTYIWSFGDNTAGSVQTDPSHTFPVIGNTSYTVILTATNYAGCVDSAETIVTIEDVLIFYVPNVFTPDGNNINNTFQPVFTSGFDVYDYHLIIFNRWGEIVFESYNAAVGWSGTYGDQGLVEDGVYIWQIEFGDNRSDRRQKERGHVTVLK